MLQDAEKTTRLLNRAMNKSAGLNDKTLNELGHYFMAMFRLIEASVRRRYQTAPWQSLLLALAAVIYLVNPFDFIPDIVFLAGLMDDATILAYVIRRIRSDIDQFIAWETAQRVTIEVAAVGEV